MPESRYHHGNLRAALVTEAVRVARESGPEGLRIRDLARRVGVSHNAAYSHFAHLDDLVSAVADEAMTQLVARARAGVNGVLAVDPVLRARRRLYAVGQAYVSFALEEPGLFRVAFASRSAESRGGGASSGGAGSIGADGIGSGDNLYSVLGEVLDELVDVGFLSRDAREGAEDMCWSAVHGFATLVLDGLLGRSDEQERTAALLRVQFAIDRSYAATTGQYVEATDLLTDGDGVPVPAARG